MSEAPVAGGTGELELLAYATSIRDLDRQENVLDELRSRAGTVLTASSILASFLGGQAIRHSGFGVVTWMALVAFIASVIVCVVILLPRPALRFALGGVDVYETLYADGENMPEVHRRLTYDIARLYETNQERIDGLVNWYRVGAIAVVLEGVLWAIDYRFG